jgi:hypothetical protein
MLSNISDLFTMASLVICMLLSGIIFYYLRTRISMLEQSVMDQAQLLQQVVTSLKSSQYRQHMNANSNSNANMISAQQQDLVKSSEMQMNLIQVSDDDSDDSDSSDSSDSDDSDDSDDSESRVNVCTLEGSCSKIIDLSTIESSANYLKPSSSHSEIKVIELTSNIRSNKDYLGNSSHDEDEDDEDDEDEDDDDDDDDEDEDDDDENEDENMNGEINDNKNENDIKSKNDELENQSHGNVNIKKMKSIVIEDPTTSVSLDEMKNMPVNSLRSLAKTKLSNIIDVPTINKMSKKDILKALHEE